jgi:hypothetical protein
MSYSNRLGFPDEEQGPGCCLDAKGEANGRICPRDLDAPPKFAVWCIDGKRVGGTAFFVGCEESPAIAAKRDEAGRMPPLLVQAEGESVPSFFTA